MIEVLIKKVFSSQDIDDFLTEIDFDRYFKKGDTVIIKPNFVAPRDNKTGATTNLDLIRIVALRLLSISAKPIIMETPGMEYDVNEVFNFLGIFEFARSINIDIYIPSKCDFKKISIPNSKVLKYVELPEMVLQSKIVNIPIMKTHVITTVTLGMKNLMGLCSNNTKRMMHIKGIHNSIIDLNKVIYPTLTIIDSLNAMEGDGAVYGNLKKFNLLLASSNTIAVDKVACQIMSINENKIKYINKTELSEKIKIRGKLISENFHLPQQGSVYHFFYRWLYLIDFLFERIFKIHFNKFLYKTGYFGTRPKINKNCTQCGVCLEVCPVDAIDINRKRINYKSCLRCLRCYEACSENMIRIKGFSGPQHST